MGGSAGAAATGVGTGMAAFFSASVAFLTAFLAVFFTGFLLRVLFLQLMGSLYQIFDDYETGLTACLMAVELSGRSGMEMKTQAGALRLASRPDCSLFTRLLR